MPIFGECTEEHRTLSVSQTTKGRKRSLKFLAQVSPNKRTNYKGVSALSMLRTVQDVGLVSRLVSREIIKQAGSHFPNSPKGVLITTGAAVAAFSVPVA